MSIFRKSKNQLLKHIEKKDNKKDLINKKTILLSTIATSVAITPIASTIYFAASSDQHYYVDQQRLGFQAAFNKLQERAEVYEYEREINATWKININGETLNFSSPLELRKKVFDEILTTQKITSPFQLENKIDINTGKLVLTDEELSKFVVNNTSKNVAVYKKNNDGVTTNEEEGYRSYFLTKDAYFFNNIYFNSKQDLRNYLVNVFLPNNQETNFNSFVVEAPNGVKSNPISTKLSDSQKSAVYLKKFIESNNEKVLKYTNSSNNQDIYFNKQNYLSSLNKINIRDLNYQHVYSNEGESRYVVDNYYTDDNNLIGPYFYEGNLDIGSFTNIDMWRRTNNIKKGVYAASRIDNSIGLFFSSIINDDNVYLLKQAEIDNKDPVIFNTPLINSFGQSIDEQFLNDLGVLSPKLKHEVITANKSLLMGKKYNTFYKLPIMYNFILNRIVSWNLSSDVYNTTIDYFTKIANFIQDAIEVVTLYNPEILIGRDNKKFNAKEFFNIGNPEYDINTSTEYFLNYFKSNYPKLVAAIAAFNGAQNNIFLTSGLIPFSGLDLTILFDYKIINSLEFESVKPTLEKIYNIFSSLNYDSMAKQFIDGAAEFNQEINNIKKLPEKDRIAAFDKLFTNNKSAEISVFLKSMGLKNTQQYNQSMSLLMTELKMFFQQGVIVKGGYLSKIRGQKSERIVTLVNYALANPDNDDIFRMYMALVIDSNNNLNIFHESMASNPQAFAQAITRISFGILASSAAVGIVVKNVYQGYKSIPSVGSHPISRAASMLSRNESEVFGINDEGYTWSKSLSLDELKIYLEPIFSPDEIKWIFSHYPTITIPEGDKILRHWMKTMTKPDPNGKDYKVLVDAMLTSVNSKNQQRIDRVEISPSNKDQISNKPFYQVTDTSVSDKPSQQPPPKPPRPNKPLPPVPTPDPTDPPVDVTPPPLPPKPPVTDPDQRPNKPLPPIPTPDPTDPPVDVTPPPLPPKPPVTDPDRRPNPPTPPTTSPPPVTPTPPPSPNPTDPPVTNPNPNPPITNKPNPNPTPPTTPDTNQPSAPDQNKPSKPNKPNKPNYPPPSPPSNNQLAPGFESNKIVVPHPVDQSKIKTQSSFRLSDIGDGAPSGSNTPALSSRKSKTRWLQSDFVKNATDKTRDVFKFLGEYFFEFLGGAFAIAEFAFLILDLLKVEEIQDFYVYTTIDGTEFIWDGGKTVSRYFGTQNTIVNKLNPGDLLTPVQITLPQIEEFYYYNQVRYYDVSELKKAFVENKLFGSEKNNNNSNFKTLYTFNKVINNDLSFAYESVEDLINGVFNNLNITSTTDQNNVISYNFSNISQNSQYISNVSFAFANGVNTNSSNTISVIADNVIENIRATKITKKIKEQNNEILDITSDFVYPGLTYKNGIFVDNSKYINDYIVDNSANQLKEGITITSGSLTKNDFAIPDPKKAERNSLDNLYKVFKQSFKLNSKNTSFVSWINSNTFSSISDTINSYTLYSVRPMGTMNSSLFLNAYDAEKYIYKNIVVSKNIETIKEKVYRIDNMNFYSVGEFSEYVKTYSKY